MVSRPKQGLNTGRKIWDTESFWNPGEKFGNFRYVFFYVIFLYKISISVIYWVVMS